MMDEKSNKKEGLRLREIGSIYTTDEYLLDYLLADGFYLSEHRYENDTYSILVAEEDE